MLTLSQGKKAIEFSRSILLATVSKKTFPIEDLPAIFNEKHGVFTTLHSYPSKQLRGCIGIPEPIMSLKNALIESTQSVTRDPRFPLLQEKEIDHVIVEITILTKPEIINSKKNEIIDSIIIGRDGLIIEQGFYKGLLLPQVPVEQHWNAQTFIEHTCLKAGLPKNAWSNEETIIKKFTGQIFSEEKPYGAIKEKTFDES